MDKTKIIRIILLSLATCFILLLGCFVGIVLMLVLPNLELSEIFINVIGVIYVEFIVIICISLWSYKLVKKAKKIFVAIGIMAIIFCICSDIYNHYLDSILTVRDGEYGVNLNEYQPYEGVRVAKLNEDSTLKLNENLPIIDCATALYPVASAFVQATYPVGEYKRYGDGVRIYESGTERAYQSLIDGDVDIIFAAEPSEEQFSAAKNAGMELKLTPIGKEAIVFFVNQKNPVDNLTVSQVQDIYSGVVKNWKKVGGVNSKIKPFQRNKNSGSQTALIKFMNGKKLMDAPTENVLDPREVIMVEVVSDYKNFKNAIGYSFRFYSTEMVDDNQIRLLKLNGVYPDKETIRSGEYPMSAEFYAITTNTDNPNVNDLINWILTPQGQYLIEKTGYVGIE